MAVAVGALRPTVGLGRRGATGLVFAALGAAMIVVFGLRVTAAAHDTFAWSVGGEFTHVPDLVLPARLSSIVLGAVVAALGLLVGSVPLPRRWHRAAVAAGITLFVVSFLCWSDADQSINIPDLFNSTLVRSIPLVLGAMSGVLCERSGVINIAIEGQLLVGAFCGAVAGTAVGSTAVGIIAAAVGGGLIGALLAIFAIRYVVDQVILGVVLNVFASGLTGFLFDRLLVPKANTLNNAPTSANLAVPVLSHIPILGPVLFNGSVFLYLTYAVLALVHFGLFHTRWGLRVRAVGEHPTAADTMGIRVLAVRYRNVILGGIIAGIGGAYLTIGSVGTFNKDMSAGKGFIALAAVIFGRWTPLGATVAALLFAFADALQNLLSIIGSPIPTEFLTMAPYLVTLVAVAGLVGRVVPPGADGKPYVKS